jgi:hypothetical protein
VVDRGRVVHIADCDYDQIVLGNSHHLAEEALVGAVVYLVQLTIQAGFFDDPSAGVIFVDRLESPSERPRRR